MTMQSDTYEIHYTLGVEDGPVPAFAAGFAPRPRSNEHTMAFNVWRAQKDTKDEVHRIKAIARALSASSEFRKVVLLKKTENTEELEFQ